MNFKKVQNIRILKMPVSESIAVYLTCLITSISIIACAVGSWIALDSEYELMTKLFIFSEGVIAVVMCAILLCISLLTKLKTMYYERILFLLIGFVGGNSIPAIILIYHIYHPAGDWLELSLVCLIGYYILCIMGYAFSKINQHLTLTNVQLYRQEYRQNVERGQQTPEYSYSACSDDSADPETVCQICEYRKQNVLLKCGHVFCERCVKDWVNQQLAYQDEVESEEVEIVCPICRVELQVRGKIRTSHRFIDAKRQSKLRRSRRRHSKNSEVTF